MNLESGDGQFYQVNETPTNVLELFDNHKLVKICAPMVRYSKIQFRTLVRKYKCDLCFTPMILAESFCQSSKARSNEFTTTPSDAPLITQFAANTVHEFVGAAHLVSPFCSGVDLNCGCPQRWARQKCLGCAMLVGEGPEKIFDIVRQCRNTINRPFTVSVKMRILKDLRQTVEICRQLESAGVSFLTVHARTAEQSTGDIDETSLKTIKDSLKSTPLVANGGLKSLEACFNLQERVNCDGVMVASALLTNPTLFTGSKTVDVQCVKSWLDICYNSSVQGRFMQKPSSTAEFPERSDVLTFQCFHHHLVFMLEKVLTRPERQVFNNLQDFKSVLVFLNKKFNIYPQPWSSIDELKQNRVFSDELNYDTPGSVYRELYFPKLDFEVGTIGSTLKEDDGKYFKLRTKLEVDEKNEENDCDWSNIFNESN